MAKHALVLGGGFAGLEAAIHLRKAALDVTLVSNRPYLFIYPTSIWIATGERPFEQVCLDLADVAARHGFRFVKAAVESIAGTRKAAVIDGWIAAGRMARVDATHLFFSIWAITQTYADFDVQVRAVLGRAKLGARDHRRAADHVVALVLRGCGL